MLHLSKYFSLKELTFSQIGARLGINNMPDTPTLTTLMKTAKKLDVVRERLNTPIYISSGYRNKILNERIGSKPTSQHVKGEAVDFTSKEFGTPRDIVKAILASGIEFDQLILEYDAWVHISFVDYDSRRQVLLIDSNGTHAFPKG